jgi:hypothetical protein
LCAQIPAARRRYNRRERYPHSRLRTVNPRFVQLLGIILVILAALMGYLVYNVIMNMGIEPGTRLLLGIVYWGILGFPELAIGVWLISRGMR